MHHNFLFDLDQTLLDFHASEYKALRIVLTRNGLSFSDEIYRAFKAYNKSLWPEKEDVLKSDWIWHMDGLMRIMADGEYTELFLDAANDWKPVLK